MLFLVESLRSCTKAPRGEMARCMLLLQLCQEARDDIRRTTKANVIDPQKAKGLEELVNLTNAYIKGVSRKEESNKPTWEYTVGRLSEVAPELSTEIKSRLDDAVKADLEAKNEEKKAKKTIKAFMGKGKRTTIDLLFVDEGRSGSEKRSYEVKQDASPHELAAVVHFSRRVETPGHFDFYRSVRDGEPPAKWHGDIPKSLSVIMNRGTFRFHVPSIPPFVRNVFRLSQYQICLRDSLGRLRSVEETDPIAVTELVCTNERSKSEERLRPLAEWRRIFEFIRAERDFYWTIHSPTVRDRTSSIVVSDGDQRRGGRRVKGYIARKY